MVLALRQLGVPFHVTVKFMVVRVRCGQICEALCGQEKEGRRKERKEEGDRAEKQGAPTSARRAVLPWGVWLPGALLVLVGFLAVVWSGVPFLTYS